MCATVPTTAATLDTLIARVADFMKLQMIIVPLVATAALASACASPDLRYGSNDYRNASVRSNENYYGVIDSIESGPAGSEIGKANTRQNVYLVRVRFDDRSYQTVTQASLDGLHVGDSVRIERDRVRRY
jgi:hypothetical protein